MLTYRPTWVAVAFLVALEVGFVAVFDPPPAALIASIVIVLAAAVGWPVALSGSGVLAARQFAVVDDDTSDAMATLAADLSALDDKQPFEQLVALGQKRAALLKVLDRRLEPGELTYSRYLTAADQVYRSALDNLHEVAVANDSVESIDTDYIDRRLAELDTSDRDSDAAQRERNTLTDRAALRDETVKRINRLLAQNEAALTTLDHTTSALADVPVGQRPEDADSAMAALAELADQARRYAPEAGR